MADVHGNRSPQGVSGHRPPSAVGDQPKSQALPHENLCAKHCCCKVKILVLLDEIEKGQEGEWRDHQSERGMPIITRVLGR